jgi:YgiT-type zinc finger domain-containing protein
MTTCYFCKGRVVEQLTSVDFWWGDDLKIIENVPTQVCEQCGEKYVPAKVYKELERLVQQPTPAANHRAVDVLQYVPAA